MVDGNYQRKNMIIMEKSDISRDIRKRMAKPAEDNEENELFEELIQILKDPTDYRNKITLATNEQREIKLQEIDELKNREINIQIPDVIKAFLIMDKRGLNSKKQTELLMKVIQNDHN